MAALDYPSRIVIAAARTAFAVRLADKVAMFLRAVANRRHLRVLSELSDHQLADIGLTRSDLRLLARERLGRDPTAVLRDVARRSAVG